MKLTIDNLIAGIEDISNEIDALKEENEQIKARVAELEKAGKSALFTLARGEGFSFNQASHLAEALEYPINSPNRVSHVIEDLRTALKGKNDG